MAKLTDAELTAITQDELEKLAEEVRQRTKATITGIKIADLAEAQQTDGTEFIIIETATETKKVSLANIPIKEVVDARHDGATDHPDLKTRLNEERKKIETDMDALRKICNELIQAVNATIPDINQFGAPTSPGMCVFDLNLNKPVWRNKDDNGWVDATGNPI